MLTRVQRTFGNAQSIALLLALSAGVLAQAVEVRTESWENSAAGFKKLGERIDAMNGRNLLARKEARGFGEASPLLSDGSAGVMGGAGRVFFNNAPSVVMFYLGGLKTITEIGVFNCNGDARANQDYEVRVVDNSAHPGQMPTFSAEPQFTTGSQVLGKNGGGFHSFFANADGSPLLPGKVDWVELRIWRTYPVKAGSPSKSPESKSGTSVVEIEVFGEANDVIVVSAEEKARAATLRQNGDRSPYEKKATWFDSMLATREAVLRWESEIDYLVAGRAGLELGKWYVLGPVPVNGEEVRQIERMKTINFAEPLPIKGKSVSFRECPEFKDGQMNDLAALFKPKAGECVVLCREMKISTAYSGKEALPFGVGMSGGKLKVVGGRASMSADDSKPVEPNQRIWSLQEQPGQYQLMAILPLNKQGQCDLWLVPQPPVSKPGAGSPQERISRRQQIYERLKSDFADAQSLQQIQWEQADNIWVRFERRAMSGRNWFPTDWNPGKPQPLIGQYNAFRALRQEALAKELSTIEPEIREKAEAWLNGVKGVEPSATLEDARKHYQAIATVQEACKEHHRIASMRLAVKDQRETFGERYPKAGDFLKRIDLLEQQMNVAWAAILDHADTGLPALLAVREKTAAESREILLANPLLAFDQLLLGIGGPGFNSNWGGPNNIGSEMAVLSPVRPDGKITTVYKASGRISDMDLSFDAKKILFSENERIHEVNVDGTGHRQITTHTDPHTKHYDACRLPNGKIMFVSTACEQAVPCTGGWYVGNMHLIDDDGTNERRLCFDQDHDWNPSVLDNGQVIYTRWEYTDTPHYFTRLLFTMNPDGSGQTEFYGSNSYWPNSMYWPRQIPGHPTQISCVVSGHHGVSRMGELVVLDNARSHTEASGVVARIGDRGKKIEPVILDGLVSEVWPRFAFPWPLAEIGTNKGSGKYFLTNMKPDEHSPWGIYLVDVFDNMTPILIGNYASPIPLRSRPTPPNVPSRIDPQRKDAQVYMANIYADGVLKGYPPGSVKALRLGSHQYRYGGNGDTYASSYEGGWDVKLILGTVPVEADGSAFFRVPANTPIFVQPLDRDGKSLQVMRSWFTTMPGETLSCVGCHERQSQAPPSYQSMAGRRAPSEIKPWLGPARGFSFDREVQPVLDHRCVGCHDGQTKDGKQLADLRAKSLHPEYKDRYSPSYVALAPYVRRAGYEADYHLPAAAEYHASTSALIQMLEKGHYNVQLSAEERERLYTWIDFNIPYAGSWRESHRPPQDEQVVRRAKYKALYANVEDSVEEPRPPAAIVAYEAPAPMPPPSEPMKIENWPLAAEQPPALQKQTGLGELRFDLGEGISLTLLPIPAGTFVMGDVNGFPDERPEARVTIPQPFYMSKLEITNRQFAQFDPKHDSGYIDGRGKDRITRGYPVNAPDQPVVRITWEQAMAFCRWLSQKAHYECSLPTEAQWEWACRAGTATPWAFGATFENARDTANIADASITSWGWGRVQRDYNDGAMFSIPGGKYKPNAWGLCDMYGNVAEWTLSEYRPYPYVENDGRNDANASGSKVVRGGSWNDTFRYARSASRWHYEACQPVYNVGFRVICKPMKLAETR